MTPPPQGGVRDRTHLSTGSQEVSLWIGDILNSESLSRKIEITKRVKEMKMSSDVGRYALDQLYKVTFEYSIRKVQYRVLKFLGSKFPKDKSVLRKKINVFYVFKNRKESIEVPEGESVEDLQDRIEKKHNAKMAIKRKGKFIQGVLSKDLPVIENSLYYCINLIK